MQVNFITKVTSRHMECNLLTPDYSQMPAVELLYIVTKKPVGQTRHSA